MYICSDVCDYRHLTYKIAKSSCLSESPSFLKTVQERFQQHCISLNVTYEDEMRAVLFLESFATCVFLPIFANNNGGLSETLSYFS